MNKLEKLTKIIQEEIPEIMELKNGCRLKIDWVGEGGDFEELIFTGRTMHDNDDDTIMEDSVMGEIVENLGRPITLEDVLIVYKKKKDIKRSYQYEDILDVWKLNKPLKQQSPETIDFLYNLLNK